MSCWHCCHYHSVKRIIPNADDKDKEELQPNGFNTVAFCTVIHGMSVYVCMLYVSMYCVCLFVCLCLAVLCIVYICMCVCVGLLCSVCGYV